MTTLFESLPEPRSLPAGREEAHRSALVDYARHQRAVVSLDAARPARRRARRYLIAAASVAASMAIVAGTAGVLDSAPAYASWTASPSGLGADELRAVGAPCVSQVQDAFPRFASAALTPVLGDRRGDFTTVLLASDRQVAMCAEWFGARSRSNDFGGTVTRHNTVNGIVMDAALPEGEVVELLAAPGQLNGEGAARIAFGLVAPQVDRIVLTTTAGLTLAASVQGGHFLAWWPSGDGIASITAFDESGATLDVVPGPVERFPAAPRLSPAPR